MSGIVNKIKEVLSSDSSDNRATHPEAQHQHGTAEGNHGPHSSRLANAADPRVDSDRDGSHNVGAGRTAGHGEYGSSNPFSGTSGTHATHGTHNTAGTHYGAGSGMAGMMGSHGASEGTQGPHSSNMANKLDPRVGSDRDGSHNMAGGREYGSSHMGTGGEYGSSNPFSGSSGMTGSRGTAEGNHGPHSSRLANAADPRVDSDRDGSHNMGGHRAGDNFGTHNTSGTHYGAGSGMTGSHGMAEGVTGMMGSHGMSGMTGTHGTSEGAYGPHSGRLGNAADPRVDSDRDGRGTHHHSGPGPAHNTAGPHSSDMANKLDPRVDSDLDGSKTLGGNKTYQ